MDHQIFNQPPNEQTAVMTPQLPSVVIYSGFWRRWLAVFIDAVIGTLISMVVGFILGRDIFVNLSFSFVFGIIYTSIFDSSEMMGTPGKALLGIVVVSKDNLQRISFKTALLRYVLKFVSGLMLCIGYLIQPFTEKRQAFHDIAAETVVIKKDLGDINYFKAFKNNFSRLINS